MDLLNIEALGTNFNYVVNIEENSNKKEIRNLLQTPSGREKLVENTRESNN